MEPFMFGGDQTFGTLGDKEAGSYLVKSRQFPQQTALLGMLKKEIMTQAGLLTRKRKGEWVDIQKKPKATALVGSEKFDMLAPNVQKIGAINTISPVFLMQKDKRFIKKADIDTYPYEDGKLNGYSGKIDIYDNFISLDSKDKYTSEKIFRAVEQTGNKKGGQDNSLFKKTSYQLKDGFTFAFYADVDFALQDSLVTLGADRSSFMMSVQEDASSLDYVDENGYMTLLSDAYITLPVGEDSCKFAIISEISHRNLKGKKTATKKHENHFEKSDTLYLYERGSVFIEPEQSLIDNINNANLQQVGYNIYTTGQE